MQIKMFKLQRLLVATILSISYGSIMAQDSSSGLEQALKDAGWDVQRDAEGSLILKPAQASTTPDRWQQFQNKLNAAGWGTKRESDGTLLLFPKGNISSKEPAVSKQADTSDRLSFQSMQQELKKTGWKVSNNTDGSILLYPPGKSAKNTIMPSPGTAPTVNVSLPVNNWQSAHNIAQGWLRQQNDFDIAVGKIRKVLKVYIVSIVSGSSPYNLKHQIAIRSRDGAVIVLN